MTLERARRLAAYNSTKEPWVIVETDVMGHYRVLRHGGAIFREMATERPDWKPIEMWDRGTFLSSWVTPVREEGVKDEPEAQSV
jgi:hypothetical protein